MRQFSGMLHKRRIFPVGYIKEAEFTVRLYIQLGFPVGYTKEWFSNLILPDLVDFLLKHDFETYFPYFSNILIQVYYP